MIGVDQQRRELPAPPFVAADREGAERVAVIALLAGDEEAPLRLADLDEILPRHLQRRFHRLRAAADEIDLRDAGRRMGDDVVGERFGDFGGEKGGMRIGDLVHLRLHRRQHVRMVVPEAGDGRASAGVDIGLAGFIGNRHAMG